MKKGIENMLSDMRDNLDCEKIELGEEEKERIYRITMQKIQKIQEENCTKERKISHQKPSFRKVLTLGLAAVLVLGLAACAVTYRYSEAFRRYFQVTDEKTDQETEVSGTTLLAEESYQGVTVKAKEVIGDAYGCYIYYQIIVDDLEEWQIPEAENLDITLPAKSYSVMEPSMGAVENGAVDYIAGVRTSEDLQGMDCSFVLSNPGYYDAADHFVPFCEHDFKLDFSLDYQSGPTEIKVGKEISIYGGTAIFDKISISPLSVTVFLTEKEPFKEHASDMEVGEIVNDELTVRFMDGNIRDSYRLTGDYDIFHDTTVISMGFRRIVSLKEIETITFAGVTIPVTENPDPVEEKTYQNEEIGISVDLPKPLYDIVVPSEIREEDGVSILDFTGNQDGNSMTLFSIFRLDGIWTEKELEEYNPQLVYLECSEGYTYAVLYGELVTEGQMAAFSGILNDYAANLKERIHIIPYTAGKISGTGKVNAEVLKVRNYAGAEADTVFLLPENETVKLLEKKGDYYKIQTGKSGTKKGYVLKKYITVNE